jgi:hypothetical protein
MMVAETTEKYLRLLVLHIFIGAQLLVRYIIIIIIIIQP